LYVGDGGTRLDSRTRYHGGPFTPMDDS